MQLTVEISMYPFNGDYIPPIQGFIDWLDQQSGIRRQTHATCTIVTGEHERVMSVLSEGLRYSYNTWGKAVFVAKFLPGFAALGDGDHEH